MAKSKDRQWIETTGKMFGYTLSKKGNMWQLKKGKKVEYEAKYLFVVKEYLMRVMGKYIDDHTTYV